MNIKTELNKQNIPRDFIVDTSLSQEIISWYAELPACIKTLGFVMGLLKQEHNSVHSETAKCPLNPNMMLFT